MQRARAYANTHSHPASPENEASHQLVTNIISNNLRCPFHRNFRRVNRVRRRRAGREGVILKARMGIGWKDRRAAGLDGLILRAKNRVEPHRLRPADRRSGEICMRRLCLGTWLFHA
jgi:hypothetical protein